MLRPTFNHNPEHELAMCLLDFGEDLGLNAAPMIFRVRKERDCFSRKTKKALVTVVVSILMVSTAPAAVRELVRMAADLNTTAKSSSPSGLTIINDELYFVANDGTHGIELWKTDGTNVARITDISPGSLSSFIGLPTLYNGEIYFRSGS